MTDNFNYQLLDNSQCLPVSSVMHSHFQSLPFSMHVDNTTMVGSNTSGVLKNNRSQNILAPMVTENSSAALAPSRQISRSSLLCPNYFMGTSKEDPRQFLYNFKLWASFQQFDEKAMLSAFQLLLKDSAAVWFKTNPKTAFMDFQELSKLFIERYTIFDKPWKEIGLLWESRQLSSQNVHDFVAEIMLRFTLIGL